MHNAYKENIMAHWSLYVVTTFQKKNYMTSVSFHFQSHMFVQIIELFT